MESFAAVGKFWLKLNGLNELGKLIIGSSSNVVLSNFNRFFPTSLGFFQLPLALSNFSETFLFQTFQVKTFQLLVLSNYTYPQNSDFIFEIETIEKFENPKHPKFEKLKKIEIENSKI